MLLRVPCPSRIDRVIVYARGALVTRRIELPERLPADSVELVAAGITALADPASVRALVRGSREVVGLRTEVVMPPAPENPGSITERLGKLDLELQRLLAERTHLFARRRAVGEVVLDPAMGRRLRPIDPAARVNDTLAMQELLAEKLEAIDARVRELDAAIELNQRANEAAQLAAVQADSGDLRGEQPTLAVRVILAAAGDSSALAEAETGIDIEYVVGAARWWPAYAARFTAGATRVEWSLGAYLTQLSGEDWDQVKLSLSTADLANDARLPELPSLRLGRAQPAARRGYRPVPEDLDAMFDGFDRARAIPAPSSVSGDDLQFTSLDGGADEITALATRDDMSAAQGRRLTQAAALDMLGSAPASSRAKDVVTRSTAIPTGSSAPQSAASFGYAAPQAPPSYGAPGSGFAPPPPSPGMLPPAMRPTSRSSTLEMTRGGSGGALAEQSGEYGDGSLRMDRPELAQSILMSSEPTAIEPAREWLDFDALTLVGGDDTDRRGRLTRHEAAGVRERASDAAAIVEQRSPPPLTEDPRASRGRFDHRYDAAGLVDAPSSRRASRVPVATAEGACAPRFCAVPRESAEVYREVELTNPLDAPLLAGPVEVFIDGALTATSRIQRVDRGGSILLGLGVEDRLRVARNARASEGSAGLLGGSTTVDHAITIDLASSLGLPVMVEVIDRLPVSDDKAVEIARTYSVPELEPYTQVERGLPVRKGVRWRVEVPAGGRARIEFGYKITLPARSEIIGGNRRE
jgi:hypothetical protein